MAGLFNKLFNVDFVKYESEGTYKPDEGLFGRLFNAVIRRAFPNVVGRKLPPKGSSGGTHSRPTIADVAQKNVEIQGPGGTIDAIFKAAQKLAEEAHKESLRANEPWYLFVQRGSAIFNGRDFTSSNVAQILYDIELGSLFVEFYTGWFYRYWPIDKREAISVYNSTSKGIWVWDNLRIRGTKLGHRKNYQLVGKGAAPLPKWTGTKRTQQTHDTQVAAESAAVPGFEVLGLGNTGPSVPYAAIGRFALKTPKTNT